ncbi:MAG TPA: cytochrome c peroxidase [Gemmataceae bacterium]|nr:cytochrome c peroxidase [Gemmataceae bacterium]
MEAGDGKVLFVANRQSGTVSVIDLKQRQPIADVQVGRSLADLVRVPGQHELLAVDQAANEVLVLATRGPAVSVKQRLRVSPDPVSIRVNEDGQRATVASRWSHCLTALDIDSAGHIQVARTIDLPFAPHQQVLAQGKAIIADAFGGRLAVVDTGSGALESVRTLPAHNIRGLAIGPEGKTVWLAHQILYPYGPTTFDDIHWGNVVASKLRRLSLTAVLSPKADVLEGSRLFALDHVGHGAADPAGLIFAADGTAVVSLAGMGEIEIGSPNQADWTRLGVGQGPTVVIASHDGRHAFVANTLADSIAVVDLRHRKSMKILLGPTPPLSTAERGELLFNDGHLAHEGWYSCQSCHTDGHTNGRLNDNLTDGSYGTPKRVPSLLGVRDTAPYAWNGQLPTLEAQIQRSIHTTMRGRDLSGQQVKDLEAFLRTLAPPPPPKPADEIAVTRGQKVFEARRCQRCHEPPTYTSARTSDVGLLDEAGNRLFNPPSLRGVSQGTSFFHDGRAGTLEEVFTRYHHELHGKLDKKDLADLLAFLRSL